VEYVALAFFCGLSAAVVGKLKGSSFFLWFLIGLVLPILGTIAAVFYRMERGQAVRACPECGKRVALHDQVCMRCGRDLEWPGAVPS
jgi:DNA-directed RNA polymerase subunit RPC12/RpoP